MSHPSVLLLARGDGVAVETPALSGRLSALDSFVEGRKTVFVDDSGFAAGTVQFNGSALIEAYPFTEMLVVHQGVVVLRSADQRLEVGVGQSAVIGRGTAVQVEATVDSQWAFCVATLATGVDQPGVVALAAQAHLTPSAPPDTSVLIGPEPQCRTQNLFEDSVSTLRIGVWDSTPYQRSARPHKVHELMHVIEGEVTLTGDNGAIVQVRPGDTAFVPQGTPCAWKSTVYVRKYYAVS